MALQALSSTLRLQAKLIRWNCPVSGPNSAPVLSITPHSSKKNASSSSLSLKPSPEQSSQQRNVACGLRTCHSMHAESKWCSVRCEATLSKHAAYTLVTHTTHAHISRGLHTLTSGTCFWKNLDRKSTLPRKCTKSPSSHGSPAGHSMKRHETMSVLEKLLEMLQRASQPNRSSDAREIKISKSKRATHHACRQPAWPPWRKCFHNEASGAPLGYGTFPWRPGPESRQMTRASQPGVADVRAWNNTC